MILGVPRNLETSKIHHVTGAYRNKLADHGPQRSQLGMMHTMHIALMLLLCCYCSYMVLVIDVIAKMVLLLCYV